MNKTKWFDILSDVRPEYIAEADSPVDFLVVNNDKDSAVEGKSNQNKNIIKENNTMKSNRKFHKSWIIIAAAAVLLTALIIPFAVMMNKTPNPGPAPVGANTTESEKKPTTPDNPKLPTTQTIPTEPKYVFVVLASEDTSSKIKEAFEDAERAGLDGTAVKENFAELEGSTVVSPKGNELPYKFSECYYADDTSKKFGTHYGIYDVYGADGEEVTVLHGTNLICLYFDKRNDDGEEVQLTEAEVKELADNFAASIVSQSIFSEFTCVSASANQSGSFAYIVSYNRLTKGYKTDENMMVCIDKFGNVAGYNGYNVRKYETLQEQFRRDDIERAENALTQKIASLNLNEVKMNDPVITADANGKLYVKINFSYQNDAGTECGETVFVNVN